MVGRSPFAPLVCGIAVAVALVVGAWFHPSVGRVSKGPSANAAPLVVDSILPATEPLRPAEAPTPLAIPTIDLPSIQPDDSAPIDPTPETADASVALDQPTPLAVVDPGVVDVAATPRIVQGPPHRVGGVPILMYHYIRVNPVATDRAGFVLSVTPADFALQMRLVLSHGFTTVTVAQIRDYVRSGKPLPPKPIAITFDDGYADAYAAALPVLQRYREIGTFYIVTGFVDQPRYVTWDQVLSLDHAGMEIASHTVRHIGLTILGGIARRSELVDSQQALQVRLGHAILDFCYPGGQVDAASEIAVRQAGYLSATTTASGLANVGDDPLRLPRVRVSGGEGLAEFAKLIGEVAMPADLLAPRTAVSSAVATSSVKGR